MFLCERDPVTGGDSCHTAAGIKCKHLQISAQTCSSLPNLPVTAKYWAVFIGKTYAIPDSVETLLCPLYIDLLASQSGHHSDGPIDLAESSKAKR